MNAHDGARSARASNISVWPHRLAVVLVCATFPLLFIGGLVTGKGAGLAVPDWPTTFGYNMFLYPWSKMVGNIFYEHSHRLVASFVGLLTIALAVALWRREPRAWLRRLGFTALGLVILQGVLGGLRVVLLEQTLAIFHAATAHLFFALTVCLAVFTSADWNRAVGEKVVNDGGRLRRLCAITTLLIYAQIIFGALLRHTGERVDAHLTFAALVTLHVIFIIIRVMTEYSAVPGLVRPALALFGLTLAQLALGTLSYIAKFTTWWRLSADPIVLLTTTHLAVGALMLGAGVALTLRAHRFSNSRKVRHGDKLFTEHLPA